MSTARLNHDVRAMLLGAFAALSLASVSTNVFAAAEARIPVSYGDLDLTKSTGAKVLYRRIEWAALEVCNDFVGPFAALRTKASACYKNAVANAVARVGSPQLSIVHRAHATQVASNY
ncbi:MAG TPA: UrcA family protein [Steroidobacteraceae bacterium]|nr:UrcA family protein [Steroidobacteraceae bacterium]